MCIKSFSKFLTAIPNLSASGSVPITKSLFSSVARSMALDNEFESSGLDEFTLVKFPSGFI